MGFSTASVLGLRYRLLGYDCGRLGWRMAGLLSRDSVAGVGDALDVLAASILLG